MKVAAYQAPLHATTSTDVVGLIREQVMWCEANGVEILCCPEGALGGLADYKAQPADIAVDAEGGRLQVLLAPLASDAVATIIGFTELGRGAASTTPPRSSTGGRSSASTASCTRR